VGQLDCGRDPYISAIRVAKNRPGVMRVVLDLKDRGQTVGISVAAIGAYGHRLVIDLYPARTTETVASPPSLPQPAMVAQRAAPGRARCRNMRG
jgi:N-acetylmuramoyl-L-alanine amidase